MNENVTIYDHLKTIIPYFKRPFRFTELMYALLKYYPSINRNTISTYLKKLVEEGFVRKTEWSIKSVPFYIHSQQIKSRASLTFLNEIPNNDHKVKFYHGFIKIKDLIEISHLHKYMPFDSPIKNDVEKWYNEIEIDIDSIESLQLFLSFQTVVIQAFKSDIVDLKIEENKTLYKNFTISFPYLTNSDVKLFFTLKGEDIIEKYRKFVIIWGLKDGKTIEEIERDFLNMNQIVSIVIIDEDNLKERERYVTELLDELNRPKSKEEIKFKDSVIALMDRELQIFRINKDELKAKKLLQYEESIKEKKEMLSKINTELNDLTQKRDAFIKKA